MKEGLESDIKTLENTIGAKDKEVQFAQAQLQQAEELTSSKAQELGASQAEQQQLRLEILRLEDNLRAYARREEEASGAEHAAQAERPP